MGVLYDSGITNSSLATTNISLGVYYETMFLVALNIACATPVALSIVTATLGWHDGISAKSHTVVVPLTSLNNYVNVLLPVFSGVFKDISLTINNIGLGQYRCYVFNHDITYT